MSALITHFCDRARPQSYPPVDIVRMSAQDRLGSILWEGRLRSFTTYSGGDPASCFTEATVGGLEFLIRARGYQPWALVFERQSIYDAGGGPVWYVRQPEYAQIPRLGLRAQAWAVRLEAGSSDWLEEREWRIPVAPTAAGDQAVLLSNLSLVALLVGDAHWRPVREGYFQRPGTAHQEWGPTLPSILRQIPLWWWDPTAGKLWQLPPFLP